LNFHLIIRYLNMDKPNPNTAFNTAINHDGEEESTRHSHF
jgi:hypothetical protein